MSLDFQKVDEFIACIDRASSLDEIFDCIRPYVETLGFERFAYWLLWPPEGPRRPLYVNSYPSGWIDYYKDQRLAADDVVMRYSSKVIRPYDWREAKQRFDLTPKQILLFGEGAEAGLRAGATVPIMGPGKARAVFSVSNNEPDEQFMKLFQGARHALHLFATYGQMKSALENMLNKWNRKIVEGRPIDLNRELTSYALDVALRSLFHLEKTDISEKIQVNLGVLLREAEQRIWALWSLPQAFVMQLPKYQRALRILRQAVDEMITDRINNPAYPNDLLSRAIHSYQSGETDYKTLQDKIVAYMTSAHETTANALVWAWYEISQRPEILKNLRDEADQVLADQEISVETVKHLDFSRQVFDEALRLYPSVWTMSREASIDDNVPLDDGTQLHIPKGTTVMLSPYVVHRLSCYWDNPLAFDPSRFERDQIAQRPKMAYFPFAGGARLCLGFRFAQIEAIIALSEIARRYDLSLLPGQDIRPEPNITLRPNREVLFAVRHRSANRGNQSTYSSSMRPKETLSACPFHGRTDRDGVMVA